MGSSVIKKCALGVVAAMLLVVVGVLAAAWHQGDRLYVVKTGSMSPTYDPGDVVVDKPATTGYRPGDVLTFQISTAGDLVTHRFTHIDKQGKIHTKGDNNKTADAWALEPEQIRGVVKSHVPNLGYLIVFMRQPAGIGGVMTATLAIFLLWGLCFPAAAPAAPAPAKSQKKKPTWVRVPQQRPATAIPALPALSVPAISSLPLAPALVQPAVLRIPPFPPPSRVVPVLEPAGARSGVATLVRIPESRTPSA